MLLTLTEAAEAAGVARSTLYRAIDAGEITRTPDKRIDTAELLRVYGELREPGKGEGGADAEASPQPPAGTAAADGEPDSPELVAWLRELVDRRERELERREAVIAEKDRELRESRSRIDELTTRLLPAPAPVTEPPRGFWRRAFGSGR